MAVSPLNVNAPEWAKSSTVDLTLWPSKERPHAGSFHTMLWSDFAKMLCEKFDRPKDALPMVRPAFYDHNYRDSKHFVYSDTVTLDCDEKNGVAFHLDEVADRIRKAGIRALIVTSSSYAPDGKQNFRLFVPVLSRVTKNNHRAVYDAVNGLIGGIAAPESWNLSQGYFYGEGSDASYSPQLLWFSGETFSLAAYKGLSLGPTKGEKSKKAPSAASEGPAISGKEQLYGRVRVPVEKAGDQTGSAWLFEVARCAVTQGLDEEAFREAADAHPEAAAHVTKKGERALQRAWGAVTEGRGDYSPPVTPEDFDIVGEAVPTKKKERFEIIWAPTDDGSDDLEPLIEGFYYEKSVAAIYGPYGGGKSFVALDQALCIASGLPWLGRTVSQGPVFYFAAEGANGMKRRIAGWCLSKKVSETPRDFALVRGALTLTDSADLNALAGAALDAGVKLIVLDTLNAIFGTGDENDTKAMTLARHAIERLRDKSGAAVLVIHHAGKDVTRGMRGSTVLGGACDHILLVDRNSIISRAPQGKQKDMEPAEDLGFSLASVSLPPDAKGRPRSTAVVEAAECQFDDISGDQNENHRPTLTQTGFALLEHRARMSGIMGPMTVEVARDWLKKKEWAKDQQANAWRGSFSRLMRDPKIKALCSDKIENEAE